MMGLIDFWKIFIEKKWDEYDKLYDYLKDVLKKYDEKMVEVKSDLSVYKKGMLDMLSKGIFVNLFVEKNEKVLE